MTEQRIGTAERESALAALGEHFAQGRLTREEYDERSDAVWSSRFAGDLQPLFADLPHGSPVPEAPRPVGPPGRAPGWVPGGPALHGDGVDGMRDHAASAWRRMPRGLQVFLAVLAVVLVVTNLPLVIVAGVLWFVLSRHRDVARPPWAQGHGCGGGRRRS